MTTPTAMVGVVVLGKYKYCKYANLNTPTTQFIVRRLQIQRSAKKNADGLYLSVLLIRIFFC